VAPKSFANNGSPGLAPRLGQAGWHPPRVTFKPSSLRGLRWRREAHPRRIESSCFCFASYYFLGPSQRAFNLIFT
jgi:hypothetical protein